MIDEEIIKALECCFVKENCESCLMNKNGSKCMNKIGKNAFDLINRQKAEIEKLEVQNTKLKNFFTICFNHDDLEEIVSRQIIELKTDVIRELVDGIAKLVKEMTEVKDNGKV